MESVELEVGQTFGWNGFDREDPTLMRLLD